jgi:hypothetical protein
MSNVGLTHNHTHKPNSPGPERARVKAAKLREIDRRYCVQMAALIGVVLICLAVNYKLCISGMADGKAFSERVGAIFYGACGALITLASGRRHA